MNTPLTSALPRLALRCQGDTCTEVCARGSVQVDRWLSHAIAQQSRLVQTLPLCYASLLGTHNSAITLADGYGALDEYFQGAWPLQPPGMRVQTGRRARGCCSRGPRWAPASAACRHRY